MKAKKRWRHLASIAIAAAATVATCVAPANATTLIRAGLEHLTEVNETIVIGKVLDSFSYWNHEGTFILTDVKVQVQELVKGGNPPEAMTVTIMGGTVGEITTLIPGIASLEIEKSYLLFLNKEDLPGAKRRLTVRDHCQGAFDLLAIDGELRARSQAWDFGLLPDDLGKSQPPGGNEGLELETLVQTISGLAAKPAERRTP